MTRTNRDRITISQHELRRAIQRGDKAIEKRLREHIATLKANDKVQPGGATD